MHLGNLSLLSAAETRSISPENFTGAKGQGGMSTDGPAANSARELGQGWKVSPFVPVGPHETITVADIEGPGAIQHIWLTVHPTWWRRLVLRIYWDDEETPSVETPLGDFFANGWCERCNISSIPVAVNPAGGFNSYWEMPFRKRARITIENLTPEPIGSIYYQVTYALTEVPENAAYFHAQWRRSNPLPYKEVHTLLDGVQGQGQYVGTYIAWGVNNTGWWGEGEIKFFLDGDGEFPTIFLGLPQVIKPDGLYRSQQRFGMYRWHIQDPIRFKEDLKVTIQALGWRSRLEDKARYLPLQDDIASTSFWYQAEPHAPFPEIGDANDLEVI
jgi:hypothetical protein